MSSDNANQGADAVTIEVTVNGAKQRRTIDVRTSLADFLRDELFLTGTKLGCEHGVCGACTVLVDGASTRSCLMLAAQVSGAEIRTVEGLAPARELSALQQAFQDGHGLQCGFCTAGFLITASELLEAQPDADEEAIRAALSGNICRCTGYETIVDAVLVAAQAGNREVA